MSQINLLKQQNSTRNWSSLALSIVIRIMAVVLLAAVAYYGWLFYQNKNYTKKITNLNGQIQAAKQSMASTPEKQEVFARQDQLKQLDTLVSNHVYWSNFFPELASSTLKSAVYDNLQADTTGVLTLTVEVPTMLELEKYLLVFDKPQYNQYFSNVRITSLNQEQSNGSLVVKADIKMDFDPHLLQYDYNKAQSK